MLIAKYLFEEGESPVHTQQKFRINLNLSRHDAITDGGSNLKQFEMFMRSNLTVVAPCPGPLRTARKPNGWTLSFGITATSSKKT